jgi:hypothetical protein
MTRKTPAISAAIRYAVLSTVSLCFMLVRYSEQRIS